MKIVDSLESDLNFTAACVLLRINIEAAEERAGILQFCAGLTRDAANREALRLALKSQNRLYSKRLANDIFDTANELLEMEQVNGWPRSETFDRLLTRLGERTATVRIPERMGVAV